MNIKKLELGKMLAERYQLGYQEGAASGKAQARREYDAELKSRETKVRIEALAKMTDSLAVVAESCTKLIGFYDKVF